MKFRKLTNSASSEVWFPVTVSFAFEVMTCLPPLGRTWLMSSVSIQRNTFTDEFALNDAGLII